MSKYTKVRCEVKNCVHNSDNNCLLDVLNINSVRFGDCHNKTETICEMFRTN